MISDHNALKARNWFLLMSVVTVIVIKNKKLSVNRVHWREARELLASLEGEGTSLDAGYVVLDADQKVIVSSQTALALSQKGWATYYV